MADVAIVNRAVTAAPKDYQLTQGQLLALKAVRAAYDGSGSAGDYVPTLQLLAPDGTVMWDAQAPETVAAGGTVAVSWFPDVAEQAQGGITSAITSLTSSGGSISVTDPSGPTSNVDVAASGVAAATYGDSTHVAQVHVGADGRISSASSVAISGSAGAGGLINLFTTTLVAPAASIDTGASAIATGHGTLLVVLTGRVNAAVATSNIQAQFNGDTAANYDYSWTRNVNGTVGSVNGGGVTSTFPGQFPGTSIGGSYPGVMLLEIPLYDQTAFWKTGRARVGYLDNTGVLFQVLDSTIGWRSTAAINQIKLTAASPNFVTGTTLAIYGVQ